MIRQTSKQERQKKSREGWTDKGLYFVWKRETHIYLLGKKGNTSLITKVSSLNAHTHTITPEIILLELLL